MGRLAERPETFFVQQLIRFKVRVVQHKNTKTLFALKYINKAKCVKMKAVANIVQERRLLEEVSLLPRYSFSEEQSLTKKIDHPFVVNMRYAFQDDENCFFVLDLMLGGDLRCRPFRTMKSG